MSLREKNKKRKYGVFLFPEEGKVGSAPTSKIVKGTLEEGSEVTLKWDKEEVPAKILRLTGMFLKAQHYNYHALTLRFLLNTVNIDRSILRASHLQRPLQVQLQWGWPWTNSK